MPDDLKISLTGPALQSLRALAAVRGVTPTAVLTTAIAHEAWLTGCATRGERVYAESDAYREELQLPQLAAVFRSRSRT